jgi:CRISPR-associated protein Csm2
MMIDVSQVVFGQPLGKDLFSDIAERAAKTVSEAGAERNKSSQLRRFYDEVVMWQEKVGKDGQRFAELEPYIRMLKAKVAYAKGRRHVDDNFEALMRHVVDQVQDASTLRHAKFFMEAFMAFYKVHRQS